MAGWRSPRIFAPLALLGALVGVVAVVELSTIDKAAPARSATTRRHSAHHRKHHARVYAIKPGDTLSLIAAKAGTTVDVLEQLNPGVDPQALHTGERLKLAR
jgi:Tfp pilus assembly protein FimV